MATILHMIAGIGVLSEHCRAINPQSNSLKSAHEKIHT